MSGRIRFGMATHLLAAFAMLIAVLVVVFALLYRRSLDERRDAAVQDTTTSAETAAALVHGLLRDLDGTTLAISRALGTQQPPITQETTGPYLAAVLSNSPFLRSIFVIDLNGRVIAGPTNENLGFDLSERDYVRALLSGQDFVLSNLLQGGLTGAPTLTLARTVRAPDGTLKALLAAAFYPDRLADLFPSTLPPDASLTVVDRRGWVVYSNTAPDIPWERRDQSGSPRLAGALRGEVTVSHGSIAPVDGDGEERLTAAVPVPQYGWAVALSRTTAAVEAPFQRWFNQQLWALGLLAVAGLLLALLLSRTLTRPLARLAEQARAVGRGERVQIAPPRGPREVDLLAEALNQMAAEVDARFAEREAAAAALGQAEARYRGIFEHAIEGIFQTRFDGRFRGVNPAAARILGYTSPEELMAEGGDISRFYVDLARRDDFVREMREHGEVTNFELQVRRRDGSTAWLVMNARGTRDASGEIDSVEGMVTDISERKRAEEAQRFLTDASAVLASSLDYAQTLERVVHLAVPQMADGCLIDMVIEDGRVRRAAVAHADPARSAAILEADRRRPLDPEAPHGPAKVLRTGRSELLAEITDAMLVAVARDEGHLRLMRELPLRSQIVAPLVSRGQVLGAITFAYIESGRRYSAVDLPVAEEIARRCAVALDNARLYQEAQAALRRERAARAEAESANQAKDEFLSVLSHELRTPLTPILGFTQLLRRQPQVSRELLDRTLATIERSAQTQARLINDLLDVSRVITGKFEIEPWPVDLAGVIQATLDAVQPAADEKGVTLASRLDATDGYVMGDADRLHQVLSNLLTNAVRFTPRGGSISVQLQEIDGEAWITVTDTGIGIPPAFLPHVFERFRQADASSTRAHGGLGLGLSIVRDLVQLHGGSVAVASEGDGRGTTFTVRLPVAAAEAVAAGEAVRGYLHDTGTPALPPGFHVLVVEDEDATRTFLRLMLEEEGATVTAVASAADALTAIEQRRPDVLLADIGMPGEDGYSLMRTLRARAGANGNAIPAIALTAYASSDDRRRALAGGFRRHLAKPVDRRALLAALVAVAAPRPALSEHGAAAGEAP